MHYRRTVWYSVAHLLEPLVTAPFMLNSAMARTPYRHGRNNLVGCLFVMLYCIIFALALFKWGTEEEMLILFISSLPVLYLLYQQKNLHNRIQHLERALENLGKKSGLEQAREPNKEAVQPDKPPAPAPLPAASAAPVAPAPASASVSVPALTLDFSLELDEEDAAQASPTLTAPLPSRFEPAAQALPKSEGLGAPGHARNGKDSTTASQKDTFAQLAHWLRTLLPKNPVVGVGLLVLFLGVSFLFKYAAQQNLVPIEYRFLAVALGALALIGWGWKLRISHQTYALSLQGGGVALLYLTIFAAARLYALLPWSLAFVLMLLLVGLSTALAILQDARSLAILASSGGFATPLLVGEQSSSHVPVFVYYSMLNCGILAIAWFKSWRELPILGFFFTFAIAGFWGQAAYAPRYFASTEPFLLFHFVLYALMAIAFSLRQPFSLYKGLDSTLVFALPVVVAMLQAGLVKNIEHGMAISSLGFAAFYLGAGWLLWQKWGEAQRSLTEAFLAIGLVFLTITIPLALSDSWTTAVWALEGAALVWLGLRQGRKLMLGFGLFVQVFAGLNFMAHPLPVLPGSVFVLHPAFFGRTCITVAALLSQYWLSKDEGPLTENQAKLTTGLLLIWALLWWYLGGIMHLAVLTSIDAAAFPQVVLLYAALSSAILLMLVKPLRWQGIWPALALLPLFMLLALIVLIMQQAAAGGTLTSMALMADWGWLAWPLAAVLAGLVLVVLAKSEERQAQAFLPYLQALLLWMALFMAGQLSAWLVHTQLNLPVNNAWVAACWGFVPALVLAALVRFGLLPATLKEEAAARPLAFAILLAIFVLQVWVLYSFTMTGQASPLPYLPMLNPLELAAMTIILGSFWYNVPVWKEATGQIVSIWHLPAANAVVLAFALLNVVIARLFHAWGDLAYRLPDMLRSTSLQASVSLVWTMLALAMTILAARKAWRWLWLSGTALLGLVVCKLMILDLAGIGTIARIVSFVGVGLLMVLIGFYAPPPRKNA